MREVVSYTSHLFVSRHGRGGGLRDDTKDTAAQEVACSKRSDSGERCEVKKAIKSRGGTI